MPQTDISMSLPPTDNPSRGCGKTDSVSFLKLAARWFLFFFSSSYPEGEITPRSVCSGHIFLPTERVTVSF